MNTNDKTTAPDNSGKPAAFTAEAIAATAHNGGPYLIAPGDARIYYSQIADIIRANFPELIGKHTAEQIDGMPGAREWFYSAASPHAIPYSFTELEADREYQEKCRELRESFARARAGYNPDGSKKSDPDEAQPARDIIAELEQKIADDLDTIDRESRFDEMMNELYSFDAIGGPFQHMEPARVLKEIDPVAYRCGVNDYADGENWIEVAGENYDGKEVEGKRDELIEELESEIEDLETEIEELEEEFETEERSKEESQAEIDDKNAKIEILKECVERLKNHSF